MCQFENEEWKPDFHRLACGRQVKDRFSQIKKISCFIETLNSKRETRNFKPFKLFDLLELFNPIVNCK